MSYYGDIELTWRCTLARKLALFCVLAATLLLTMFITQGQAEEEDVPPSVEQLQGVEGTANEGLVEILAPAPVQEVWAVGDVLGSAAVPGMAYYYLEYAPLDDTLNVPESATWLPLTIGITEQVIDDVLATIDSRTIPDGLYALRLVVNTLDGIGYTDTVTPIRVNNVRYNQTVDNLIAELEERYGIVVTPEPTPEIEPPPDGSLLVAVAPDYSAVNTRYCTVIDNAQCPVVGILTSREPAEALGITANGWFYIRLPSGITGYVSPAVVTFSGDINSLPLNTPPRPLPGSPPSTPTPDVRADVIVNGLAIEGRDATCLQDFNVRVNVYNRGSGVSNPGTVAVQDIHVASGTIAASAYGSYPALNPGTNYTVVVPLNVSVFINETHELRAQSGDSRVSINYVLRQGDCLQPAPTTPPPTTPPSSRDFAPGECVVIPRPNAIYSSVPGGPPVAGLIVDPGEKEAVCVREVAGSGLWWYIQLNEDAMSRYWIGLRDVQSFLGNCDL